jgi:hypothetical protein
MTSKNSLPNPNIVHADPAKGFFVSMLIKDITLRDAIGDLVDNSVDAIKQRAANVADLAGFEVEIKLGKSFFSIEDNGFGMEAEVARKTAFNFGKSSEHKLIDMSIGQFGIGMKRAFFKLGKKILVKSIAETSQFELTIDVDKWLQDPKTWEFRFDENTLKEKVKNIPANTGVKVHISDLSFDSKTSFDDLTFIDQLRQEIALEHMLNINKGLSIKINGQELPTDEITLVMDEKIKPTLWEKISSDRSVRILAGISEKSVNEGGWYIFCNDRLILAHDQSAETGWGDGFAKYHAQYHRFRGYVFFEAQDSSNLPWNTTKTGMDVDSPYYKEVKGKMVTMTKQVFGLLDKLKTEKTKNNPDDSQILNKAVEKSLKTVVNVPEILNSKVVLDNKFHFPVELYNPPSKSNSVKIAYEISSERYEAIKQHMGESDTKEIGLNTFNYYYENEI